jgi:hypothetical protein
MSEKEIWFANRSYGTRAMRDNNPSKRILIFHAVDAVSSLGQNCKEYTLKIH